MATSAARILKKKHYRVKHQKVKLFRANDPMLSVFMWGINHSINELSHCLIPTLLLPDHFRANSKIKVDNHLFNKENMPSHFKFKEYCPIVFKNLRERFGIDDSDFRDSLTRSEPIQMDSSGKSGAKFYRSFDHIYVIKSLTSEEVERMHSFLKHYHPYVVEKHGSTLLPNFLGMYRLTVDGVQYYFTIMRNVFSSHLKIHQKFDLKGSTVDRSCNENELNKSLPTFKDNDFTRQGIKISIGPAAKEKLHETLASDVEFLTKLHLMDYSLLIGIHDIQAEDAATEFSDAHHDTDDSECERWENTPPDSPRQTEAHMINPDLDVYAIPSKEENKFIYFIAIIDPLTNYGFKKQAAKAAKTVKYGSNVDGISTCDPEQYGKRFLEFILDRVIE